MSKVERKLFQDLIDHAEPSVAKRLARRVEQVNLVQRSSDGQEINLYCWKRGEVKFDQGNALSEWGDGEAVLAEARYKIDGAIVRAKYLIVGAQLFSVDLSEAIPSSATLELQSLKFCSPKLANELALSNGELLPDDLDRELRSDNVKRLAGCTVFDTKDRYLVETGGGAIVVVAEVVDSGLIGVGDTESGGEYVLLSYEGVGPIRLGRQFDAALKKAMEGH